MSSESSLTLGEKKSLMQSFTSFSSKKKHSFLWKDDSSKIVTKKTTALKKLFSLPDGELLIDISASIKTCQMDLPGRLFILDKYILFYSDLFHVEQKITIPLTDIHKISPDPVTNIVAMDITSQNTTFYFTLSGRYKEDVMKYFKTMDAKCLLPATKTDATSHEEEEDDEGLEWISNAAKEEGFLDGEVEHRNVVSTELPISIKRFYDCFLKDESFFISFYEAMGRTDITTQHWQSHPELGNLRNASYRVKVNSPIGPPTTMMDEVQRYYNQSSDKNHIVLELTDSARDVKYGDSFRVESKWDIVGVGNKVKLDITVGVPFVKKIYIPGVASMIKSKSI